MLIYKNRKIKKTFAVLLVLICIGGIGLGVFSIVNFLDNSENKIEGIIKTYNKHKNVFNVTADYLSKLNGNIYIHKDYYKDVIIENRINSRTSRIEFAEENISSNIKVIMDKYGFKIISEEGNSIYFQKTSFLKYANGLVYSKDGNTPDWENLTTIKKIEGNWYYFSEG